MNKEQNTKSSKDKNNLEAKDKSWNKQFKKSSEKGKKSAKELADQKRRELEDKLIDKAANTTGIKGKIIAAGIKKIRNNKFLNTLSKIATFISMNLKTILMTSFFIVLFLNLAIMGISISQAIGESPHYYCDIDADKGIKRSGLYQQYCTNGTIGFTLDNINGHYIVQDGSGPCTDCACLNLLLRYYTSKDINLYDYLWDNSGQFIADNGALALDTALGNTSIRHYIAAAGNTSCSNKNLTRGTKWFAKKHPTQNISNSNNFTKANWGYVRDETLSFEGLGLKEAIETEDAKNISTNDNWVWDLSCETSWSAQWTEGNYITIDNVVATWEYPDKWSNKEELKDLLEKYPSGVVAWRNYGSGKYHAILITGWNEEENCFNVVDSALATSGGFEGPANSSNFVIQSIWNESQIESCANVEKLVVIKEDKQ